MLAQERVRLTVSQKRIMIRFSSPTFLVHDFSLYLPTPHSNKNIKWSGVTGVTRRTGKTEVTEGTRKQGNKGNKGNKGTVEQGKQGNK